jgi:hypothetical protein
MSGTVSKQRGTAGETAVVRWLRVNGWPGAERRALHGTQDQGDITGCLGLVWEIKSGHKAETAGDALITEWMRQTDVERGNADADFGVLVTKRLGHGPANAGAWWAWITADALVNMRGASQLEPAGYQWTAPIRCTLHDLALILRGAGYGDPIRQPELEAQR